MPGNRENVVKTLDAVTLTKIARCCPDGHAPVHEASVNVAPLSGTHWHVRDAFATTPLTFGAAAVAADCMPAASPLRATECAPYCAPARAAVVNAIAV